MAASPRLAGLLLPLGLSLGACRDELLQTALRVPGLGTGGSSNGDELECEMLPTEVTLPTDPLLGGGASLGAAPFLPAGYRALEGPGVSILARDAFRVFVNGVLVAEAESPREPVFVPLSLLPGDNVIAIVVATGKGRPAALVHVAELSRDYRSDHEWKVSRTPTPGWTEAGYDDVGWSPAAEFGSAGELPGCEPGTTFPPATSARWIGAEDPSSEPIALRRVIRVAPEGFGAATTGGGSAPAEIVEDFSALDEALRAEGPRTILLPEGVYDFRRTGDDVEGRNACEVACSDVPGRSTRSILSADSVCSGTEVPVTLEARQLRITSNKTLVGLGRGAALRGVSIDLGASENVVLRNVAVYDLNRPIREAGDAFTLAGATRVWLDHVTAVGISDAFADVLSGSSALTISYVSFDGRTEGECDGREQWTTTLTDATASIHHSRFEHLRRRAPSVVGPRARVHLWNNLYSDITDWTVGTNCGAELLVEGCVFENVEGATAKVGCDGDGPGLIDAPAGSNLYRDATVVHLGGDGEEPHDSVFSPPYAYELELATEALGTVAARAGTGGPWALPLSLE